MCHASAASSLSMGANAASSHAAARSHLSDVLVGAQEALNVTEHLGDRHV